MKKYNHNKGQKRNTLIHFKLTESEKKKLDRLQEEAGISNRSEMIREIIVSFQSHYNLIPLINKNAEEILKELKGGKRK